MRIALDVDGCIANFYKAACKKYDIEYGMVEQWETPFIEENWDAISADTDFWRTLELMNSVDFEFHCYLTSIPTHIIEHRQFWIDSNELPNRPLIVSYDKVAVAVEHELDILIDDKPDNIEKWIKSGRKAIQYIPHYSNMPLKSPYYTNDFGEIKNILKCLKEKYYGEEVRGIPDVPTSK